MGGGDLSTLRLDANPQAIAAARELVRDALDQAVPRPVVRDLELIASELFTNAVEHGDNEEIDVLVRRAADFAEVTVVSHGSAPSVADSREWVIASPESSSGRGLGIVRRLADEVRVDRRDGHLVVTARRLIPG